jgi:hypothetical protein
MNTEFFVLYSNKHKGYYDKKGWDHADGSSSWFRPEICNSTRRYKTIDSAFAYFNEGFNEQYDLVIAKVVLRNQQYVVTALPDDKITQSLLKKPQRMLQKN